MLKNLLHTDTGWNIRFDAYILIDFIKTIILIENRTSNILSFITDRIYTNALLTQWKYEDNGSC